MRLLRQKRSGEPDAVVTRAGGYPDEDAEGITGK